MEIAIYAGLFGSSFIAATLVPAASEAALVAAIKIELQHAPVLAVTVATAGNFLGACTTYWIARGIASAARGRRTEADPGQRERAAALFRRWGEPALLLSWLPLIGDGLVAAAGLSRIPLHRFALWTVLGKAARYAALAWVVAGKTD